MIDLTQSRRMLFCMYDAFPVYEGGEYHDTWQLFRSYAYTVIYPRTIPSRVKQNIEKYDFNE
jgi:hypothetical protein